MPVYSDQAAALVIGLGGTGVRTLRALQEALGESRRVVLLGVDLDVASNAFGGKVGEAPALSGRDFLLLDGDRIDDFVENATAREPPSPESEAEDFVFPHILKWFREFPRGSGQRISVGQVREGGAGQWRSLGRVALHLDFSKFERRLGQAIVEAFQTTELDRAPRIHLVCSLAGGTGSGMLLDVAYLLSERRPDAEIHAYLLLPDAFEAVDNAGRIRQNTYAALKEIAQFKNQRSHYHVAFPNGRLVDCAPGGRGPFTFVNVYGAFSVSRGVERADSEQRLWHMNRELAANILASNTHLVIDQLAPGRRNLRGDAAAAPASRKSSWVFSTTATLPIPCPSRSELLAAIRRTVVHALAERARLCQPGRDLRHGGTAVDVWSEEIDKVKDSLKSELHEGQRRLAGEVREIGTRGPGAESQLANKGIDLAEGSGRVVRDRVLGALGLEKLENKAREALRAVLEKAVATVGDIANPSDRLRATSELASVVRAHRAAPSPGAPWVAQPLRITWRNGGLGGLLRGYAPNVGTPERFAAACDGFAKIVEECPCDPSPEWANPILSSCLEAIEMREEAARVQCEIASREEARRAEQAAWLDDICRASAGPLVEVVEPFWDAHRGDLQARVSTIDFPARDVQALERTVEQVSEQLLGHSLRHREFLLHLLGSSALIAERVRASLARIFRHRRENPMEACEAVVFLPKPTGLDEVHDYLQQVVLAEIKTRLGCVELTEVRDRDGMVYVQDRSLSADCIERIHEYHRAYHAHPRWERAYFHTDRLYVDLPDLVSSWLVPDPIPCGNPGCTRDIRDVPRDSILCPTCRKPIRSRCGNRSCVADDLHRTFRPRLDVWFASSDREDRLPPSICPACGGFVRTAWWRCTESSHTLVPVEERECPKCREEAELGARVSSAVGQRPPDVEFTCPSCSVHGEEQPFHVPQQILRGYRDGVSPGEADRFHQVALAAGLLAGRRCPTCHAVLIPCIPFEPDGACGPLLHRRSGRFLLPDGTPFPSLVCSGCGFPIDAAEKRPRCPRCDRKLVRCAVCSNETGSFSASLVADPTVCSNCLNPLASSSNEVRTIAEWEGAKALTACTNVHECAAGSRLAWAWSAAGEPRCRLCSEPVKPVYLLPGLISACPVCSKLIPIEGLSFVPPPEDDQTFCEVCGANRSRVARLGKTGEGRTSVEQPSLDNIVWLLGLVRSHREGDQDVLHAIHRQFKIDPVWFAAFSNAALQFFGGRPKRRLAQVVEEICAAWERANGSGTLTQ